MAKPTRISSARSRTDLLVEAIGRRIASGEFAPGSALPVEAELSHAHAAGRNIVREAVKVLAGKGMVRTVRRAGTIVRPQTEWSMLDPDLLCWVLDIPEQREQLLVSLIHLRQIIEPAAAALAASQASAAQREALLRACHVMERHRHDRDQAIAADVAFHATLFEATGNPLLASMARSVEALLRSTFEAVIEQEEGFIRNLVQHRRVAEAVVDGDGERAAGAMRTLLRNSRLDLARMQSDVSYAIDR